MRFLLDEDVSPSIAIAMQAIAPPDDTFQHIVALAAGKTGTTDDEVVALCHEHGIDVLITLNVRDFGAKKHYYAALSERGIHVIVVRPGKAQPDVGQQLALIAAQFIHARELLANATGPMLLRVTRTAVVARTLDELLAEVHGLP